MVFARFVRFARLVAQPYTQLTRRQLMYGAVGTFVSTSIALVAFDRLERALASSGKRVAAAAAPAFDSQLKAFDALFDQGQAKVPELYAALKAVTLAPAPERSAAQSAELLWRLARAARLMSMDPSVAKDKAAAKALAFECLDLAQQAVRADDGNWAAHKWLAIGYKVVGDHLPTKEKLQNSFTIRDEFVRALELNPRDATTTCLLGQWMFYFADMPWYERQAASLLFASPPQSSYEAALEQFLKAEALEPGFYKKNAQMIASTYARLGKQAEAKEWKAKALAMPTKTLDDEEAHSQALKL
jgi:hypothetical protein